MIEFGLGALKHWPVSDDKIRLGLQAETLAGRLAAAAPTQAHVYWNGTFSETEKTVAAERGTAGVRSMPCCNRSTSCRPAKTIWRRILCFDQKYYLPDDILVKSRTV